MWLSLYEFIPCISHSQGTIPKKPYNPILGEIFRCYWDLPDGNRVAPTAEAKVLVTTGHGISDSIIDIITQHVIENGPVPFSNYCSVTFLAEQVSHHPPG